MYCITTNYAFTTILLTNSTTTKNKLLSLTDPLDNQQNAEIKI